LPLVEHTKKGRTIYLSPDNDFQDTGKLFFDKIVTHLLELGADPKQIRIIDPTQYGFSQPTEKEHPDNKKDVVNWIESRFDSPQMNEDIQNEFKAILNEADPINPEDYAPKEEERPEAEYSKDNKPTQSKRRYIPQRPFPLEVFPDSIRKFIEKVSASGSKPIDPAAYGLAFLAAMTATVGRSRVLKIDKGSLVRASIYCAVVGYPASGKSKPISEVMKFTEPFRQRLKEEHKEAKRNYTQALRAWKEAREGDEPEAPKAKNFYHDDATPEALQKAVINYPDRTLYAVDELTKLERSYNGKQGIDSTILSMYGGGGFSRTRVEDGHEGTLSSAVSIIGGLTPETFTTLFLGENAGNGFASRFVKWKVNTYDHQTSKENRVGPDSKEELELSRLKVEITNLFDSVFQIPIPKIEGEPDWEKITVYLSEAAYEKWEEWTATNFDPKINATPKNSPLRWNLDRFPHALKVFILVFHVFQQAENGQANEVGEVQPETIEKVTILADALIYECERLNESVGNEFTNEQHKIYKYLEKKSKDSPEGLTLRDFQRAEILKHATSEQLGKVLQELCEMGHVEENHVPTTASGGTPTKKYSLAKHD